MTTMQAATGRQRPSAGSAINEAGWDRAALGLLSVRIVQGFIFWGGGSRRFIYDPEKLDPDSHTWMANKLQDAMPGALFGTDHIISFLLKNFDLLYATIIVFSAGELIVGLMLIAGLLTRAAAVGALGFSILLMVMFGWQGAICLEGWTMAACNIAMACALILNGSSAYALDNVLIRRNPDLAERPWFRWSGGCLPLPMSEGAYRRLALTVSTLATAFIIGLYGHYRGSVVTPYHPGPVSSSVTHFSLTKARLTAEAVSVRLYLDAGTPEAPAFIVEAAVTDGAGKSLASWDAAALAALPPERLVNEYSYNQVVTGPYGLVALMGAKAEISLPLGQPIPELPSDTALVLTTVDGSNFVAKLVAEPRP